MERRALETRRAFAWLACGDWAALVSPPVSRHFIRCLLLRLPVALAMAFGACKRAVPPIETGGPGVGEKAAVAPEETAHATAQALAAIFQKALTAYNAGDQTALFADFARTATPPPSDRIFTELFEGYYKTEFGRILAVRLSEQDSVPDADFGMLVCLAQCERQPLAQISANFVRENGQPKIVQLRIEKVEVAGQ